MTHDPVCPQPKCDYGSFNDDACHGFSECPHRCQCDLIAKVRADEKSRLIRSVIVYDYSGILIRPEVGAWIALQDLEKS